MASGTSMNLLILLGLFILLAKHHTHARQLLDKVHQDHTEQQDLDSNDNKVAQNGKDNLADNKDVVAQPNQIPIPGIPGLPLPPSIPGIPGIPGLPGGGGIPGIPGLPGGGGIPGIPGLPGGGGIPALPIPGITPGVPALPIPGITPGVPALPIPGITPGVPALPIPTIPLPPFPFLTPPPLV